MEGTKLTGLWKNKSKKEGKPYLAGNIGPLARILVLPNDFKKGENDPDYNMFIVPRDNGQKDDKAEDDVPI